MTPIQISLPPWVVCAVAITVASTACARTAPRLSADSIRRVRVGMNMTEVESILGKPLDTRSESVGRTIHDYALARFSGPSLWVSYENDRVILVHAKLYKVFGEDHAIYEEAPHHSRFETAEFEAVFKSH